jgi:predicted nucleotidyltransferase
LVRAWNHQAHFSGGDLSMTVEELVKEKRQEILRIAAEHGARNVRVFGSAVRGEAGADSDIDFLVDFEPGRSLLDHVALIQDLQELFGRKTDVVTERGLYWLLRRRILKEARAL